MTLTIPTLSLYSIIAHYIFRPNWSSSGVQVVLVKDSAAHCNVVFFPPTVVMYDIINYSEPFIFLSCSNRFFTNFYNIKGNVII
jgi:hypothetical protein